jgi:hypothetical protein
MTKTTQKVEDEGVAGNGLAKVTKGACNALYLTAVLADREVH